MPKQKKLIILGTLLLILVFTVGFFFVPRRVTIRLSPGVPETLGSAWRQGSAETQTLKRLTLTWIDAGPCDLQISDTAPLDSSWVLQEGDVSLPQDLGDYRTELRDPHSGARALAASPLIFVPPTSGRYPEKWAALEKLGLRSVAWAELPSSSPWILALDQRKMKRLWLSRCSPETTLSSAAQKVARWLYSVEGQNKVIQAKYYSPWSKMVDPQGVRPWGELEIIPLQPLQN